MTRIGYREAEKHFGVCERAVATTGNLLVNRAPGVWLVRDSAGNTIVEYWPTSQKWRDVATGRMHYGRFTKLIEHIEARPRRDEQSVLE